MGIFVPETFDIRSVDNHTERAFLEELRDQASDSWHLIPSLSFRHRNRDFEIDCLIFHRELGVAALEVKGGKIDVSHGRWTAYGDEMSPSPVAQVRGATYALRDKLRNVRPSLEQIKIQYAVVLPATRRVSDREMADLTRSQLFTAEDLNTLDIYLTDLMTESWTPQRFSDDQIQDMVDFLLPDNPFQWSPDAQATRSRERMNQLSAARVGTLATLDMNRRVMVHGAAGSGKTRLAMEWARRSMARGDRTLLTCHNIPLGEYLSAQFADFANDPDLRVGFMEQILDSLSAPHGVEYPPEPDDEFFSELLPRAVRDIIEESGVQFDTVIVDEIQDFSRDQIETLMALLPAGGRLLCVGDEGQNLFDNEGMRFIRSLQPTEALLTENCRNTRNIGNLLHQFGGALCPAGSPEGEEVEGYTVRDRDELLDTLRAVTFGLVHEEVRDPTGILVVTFENEIRNAIVADKRGPVIFQRWEYRGDNDVLCESVRRTKGLEFDTVILAALTHDIPDRDLYVAVSRAATRLIVIGPSELNERFDLN